MANPIKRYAGDDWRFPFRYRDKDGVGIDITGFTPSAILTNSKDHDQEIEITTAGIEDQTAEETKGRFWIEVPSSITDNLVYPVPPNQSFNIEIRRVMAKLRIMLNREGKRKTYGVLFVDVQRA